MKTLVVVSIGTLLLATGTVAQSQTARRKVPKNEVNRPSNDTMKICQGLAIPQGYTIVGYMTSSACPHGAYVLKRQTDYESSLSMGRKASTNEGESAPAATIGSTPGKSPGPAKGAPARASASTGNSSAQRAATSMASSDRFSQPAGASADSSSGSGQPAATAVASSRPRRIGATQPQAPTLAGADDPRPARPPTLSERPFADSSTTSADSSENSSAGKSVAPAAPEEVSEGDVVRVDTAFVTVPVSVTDRLGRFIPNLKREDFKVFENGAEQSIAYFENEEKPFTVALLLDASPSTQFHLSDIKEAAIAFAKQLRPQDRVLIISFSDEVLLLTEATNDISTITQVVLANVREGNSTRLYDAVHLAIKERMDRIPGRKAMVLFTDGVDTSSNGATYKSTLDEAEELDALVYPIRYDTSDYMRAFQNGGGTVTTVTRSSNGPFGSQTTTSRVIYPSINGGRPLPGTTQADYDRADQYLHALADSSGGRLYQANDLTQLSNAFRSIAQELRWQYSIGYYPKAATDEGGERRQIKVRVDQPDLAVKARASYMRSPATTTAK